MKYSESKNRTQDALNAGVSTSRTNILCSCLCPVRSRCYKHMHKNKDTLSNCACARAYDRLCTSSQYTYAGANIVMKTKPF